MTTVRNLPMTVDDDDVRAIGQQVCFALYAASRAMVAVYRPMLDRLGLTYPQYLVMTVLWERRAATVSEVATALRLTTGTLSPLLKRLEIAGLITRTRLAADERTVEIRPTTPGRDLQIAARQLGAEVTASLVGGADGVPVGDLVALRRLLERMTAEADRAAG